MNLSELVERVFDDLEQPNDANNELLTEARVLRALNDAYRELAQKTNCFRRGASVALVDEEALYPIPRDMYAIERRGVVLGEYALDKTTPSELATFVTNDWRNTAPGTPQLWYLMGANSIGLYPPPTVSEETSIAVHGYIIPFSIGGGIKEIARTDNVAEVLMNSAHGLTVGELVSIRGVDGDGYDADGVPAKEIVAADIFTYDNEGEDDETGVDGLVLYVGGVLPLIDNGDTPELNPVYHEAIVGYAVWRLASRYMREQPVAMERGTAGLADFQRLANILSGELYDL